MIDNVAMDLRETYQFLESIEVLHNTNGSFSTSLNLLTAEYFPEKVFL